MALPLARNKLKLTAKALIPTPGGSKGEEGTFTSGGEEDTAGSTLAAPEGHVEREAVVTAGVKALEASSDASEGRLAEVQRSVVDGRGGEGDTTETSDLVTLA